MEIISSCESHASMLAGMVPSQTPEREDWNNAPAWVGDRVAAGQACTPRFSGTDSNHNNDLPSRSHSSVQNTTNIAGCLEALVVVAGHQSSGAAMRFKLLVSTEDNDHPILVPDQ
jgi:hypothetical protein